MNHAVDIAGIPDDGGEAEAGNRPVRNDGIGADRIYDIDDSGKRHVEIGPDPPTGTEQRFEMGRK